MLHVSFFLEQCACRQKRNNLSAIAAIKRSRKQQIMLCVLWHPLEVGEWIEGEASCDIFTLRLISSPNQKISKMGFHSSFGFFAQGLTKQELKPKGLLLSKVQAGVKQVAEDRASLIDSNFKWTRLSSRRRPNQQIISLSLKYCKNTHYFILLFCFGFWNAGLALSFLGGQAYTTTRKLAIFTAR